MDGTSAIFAGHFISSSVPVAEEVVACAPTGTQAQDVRLEVKRSMVIGSVSFIDPRYSIYEGVISYNIERLDVCFSGDFLRILPW